MALGVLLPVMGAEACERVHVVSSGETLSIIAKEHYGDVHAYRRLFAANTGTIGRNPNVIHPGMTLRVPCAEDAAPSIDHAETASGVTVKRLLPQAIAGAVRASSARSTAPGAAVIIDAAGLARSLRRGEGTQIIDLASTTAGQRGFVDGAVSVPYQAWGQIAASREDLQPFLMEAAIGLDRPIAIVPGGITYRHFNEAAQVYWLLASAGAEQLALLDGAPATWQRAGLKLAGTARVPGNLPDRGTAPLRAGEGQAALSEASSIIEVTFLTQPSGGEAAATLAELALETVDRLKTLDAPWEQQAVHLMDGAGDMAAAAWFALSEVARIPNVRLLRRPGTRVPDTGLLAKATRSEIQAVPAPSGISGRVASTHGAAGASGVRSVAARGHALHAHRAAGVKRPAVERQPAALAAGLLPDARSAIRLDRTPAPRIGTTPPDVLIMNINPLSKDGSCATVPPAPRRLGASVRRTSRGGC